MSGKPRIRSKVTDPIGPGTPAWDQFDKAVHAWRTTPNTGDHDGKHRGLIKRYYNHRQQMLNHVAKHDPTKVNAWAEALDKAKDDPTWDDLYAEAG